MTPEFQDHPSLANIKVPDNLAPIIDLERELRYTAFSQLRSEIDRVEELGARDPSTQSSHYTFIGEGIARRVLFYAANCDGLGRVHRVMVNDGRITEKEEWEISASDYIVPVHHRLITGQHGVIRRPKSQHSWNKITNAIPPLLYKLSNGITVQRTKGYRTSIPNTTSPKKYEEVLDRRENAEKLAAVLFGLNEITREDGILIAD